RPARLPHGHWTGPADVAAATRLARTVRAGVLHAHGAGRVVLALRRYRLDLPVPVVIPDQPALGSDLEDSWHKNTHILRPGSTWGSLALSCSLPSRPGR